MENNVYLLQEAHQESKNIFFKKGLPFYTCIDAVNNIWKKELLDGTSTLVKLVFDWEKDEPKESALQ